MFEFPKSHRLVQGSEFEAMRTRGRKLQCDGVLVVYASNTVGHPRLGIIVSKRVSNKAVDRNRIKRKLREGFRQCPNLKALDFLCIVQKSLATMDKDKLKTALASLWPSFQDLG